MKMHYGMGNYITKKYKYTSKNETEKYLMIISAF